MKIWVAVVGMLCLGSAAAQTPDDLQKMLDANQDFALRDAVERGGAKVPVFYRGAVEAALNEGGARDARPGGGDSPGSAFAGGV